MRSMFVQVPMMSGAASVRHVEVSVPLVPQLLDQGKYYMTPKPIDDETERRRHRHRGPTLRSLVRLARQCDSAEELGKQLRRRYQRQRQRAGLTPAGRATAEAELDRLLARD
ncbi:hypothetical protein [Bradyrhizobium sp. AUGA SZCCT0042]|uniref:hypothetical protein n=1 Tax=Bradyrhizobium sp. AUGA SZCCT0042 TaxID=2807651 RepID=UPI001BA6067A|nr:hypothetical protein [Bradyrhizobium sp. AUGA SZCCT0042]MBR1296654.1 hypothetical protein [Bradyrhizobium sp. AUGA SZCCT0042]